MSHIRMLRMPAVMERTGLARSTIYFLMAKGEFPRSVNISQKAAGWVESELDDFLAERIALRGEA